jgi:beta-lactamase superfamily II metal-dependent hydrolase
MFSLGKADSILVTSWTGSTVVRVLIDGGNSGDAATILGKLSSRQIKHLDHVVCSHPHDDHAGGLEHILKSPALTIGKVWTHLPWKHIDYQRLRMLLSAVDQKKVARIISRSLETQRKIAEIIDARKIPFEEPFQGASIGPLFVCGPSRQFYRALLRDFADLQKLSEFDSNLQSYELARTIEEIFGTESEGDLGGAPTAPENDSSVILFAGHGTSRLLFTADAGVPALTAVVNAYDLSNLSWMQIPHHGSRRNLTRELVEYFRPAVAFVSADGTVKHPRRKVVNAFKAVGTKVYSTHHPSALDIFQQFGGPPPRADFSPAVSL